MPKQCNLCDATDHDSDDCPKRPSLPQHPVADADDDPRRWVCTACGKTSRDRYGDRADAGRSQMWDVSCTMHAVWCRPRTEADTNSDYRWFAVDETTGADR